MDSEWAAIARDLAAVVRRGEALKVEAGQLAVKREQLERRLAEMLAAAERSVRVPEWASERRALTVAPGHGAVTSRLAPNQPALSQLSTATPCPSDCVQRRVHSHYADGVTQIWE